MKTSFRTAIYAAVATLAITSASADTAAKKKGMKHEAMFVMPADIHWMPAPPDLPKGAEIGVLMGDPGKPAPYVVRLRAPDGYKVPPHWHSKDEQLTVISGTLTLHMGDTMNDPHDMPAGAFHFLPGKAHHAAVAKGETIVQIAGVGPFDIHYLNPEDNPNPNPKMTKSARR